MNNIKLEPVIAEILFKSDMLGLPYLYFFTYYSVLFLPSVCRSRNEQLGVVNNLPWYLENHMSEKS